MITLGLALAGALGAVTRFVVDSSVKARFRGAFPLGTLLINITGSLLLGLITGLVTVHQQPHALLTVAGTGFCGGYTTFSTASFEAVRLLQNQKWTAATATVLLGTTLPLAAALLGLLLTGASPDHLTCGGR